MQGVRSTAVVLIAVSLILSSCDDGPPKGGGSVYTIARFPSAIGTLYKYKVYDSLTRATDTVWLSVTDTSVNNFGVPYTEVREKRVRAHSYDWHYYRTAGDTIDIIDHNISAQSGERFVFPLRVGSSWINPSGIADSSFVDTSGSVIVPAGSLGKGLRVDRAWNGDLEGGGSWSQTWLIPDIGVASRSFLTKYSDGNSLTTTKNEVWRLISYDLGSFDITNYPLDSGNVWRYEQIDSTFHGPNSLTVSHDTVTITIVRKGTLSTGNEFAMQRIVSVTGVDTQFVITDSQMLRLQADSMSSGPNDLSIDFPLAVGRYWGVSLPAQMTSATDREPILAPAGIYQSCFHTIAYGNVSGHAWMEDDWLCPGVGIVRSSRRVNTYVEQVITTRLLIDFEQSK